MNDEYWFWLTFPGGVVIGLVVFGPLIAAYFFWQWYKADKEKQDRQKLYDEHFTRIRDKRESNKLPATDRPEARQRGQK